MNFKKTLALCLSLLILAGCAITGTLAFPNFLSDTPDETEAEGQQDSKIEIELNVDQDIGVNIFPGEPLKKEVSITNTLSSTEEAYVWYTYAVPKALFLPDKIDENALTGSFEANTKWLNNAPVYADGKNYCEVEYDEKPFIEFTCLYTEALNIDEKTEISLKSVTLDRRIDRENNTYVWVEKGERIPLDYDSDTIEIYFHAYAICANETLFDNVEEAYALYGNSDQTTAEAIAN